MKPGLLPLEVGSATACYLPSVKIPLSTEHLEHCYISLSNPCQILRVALQIFLKYQRRHMSNADYVKQPIVSNHRICQTADCEKSWVYRYF